MELTNNSKFKSVFVIIPVTDVSWSLWVSSSTCPAHSGLVPPGLGSSQSQWLGGLTAARLTNSQLVCLTGSLINLTFKGLKN